MSRWSATAGDGKITPTASTYFRKTGPDTWYLIGSGAMYGGPNGIPMNDKLARVLDSLHRAGIQVHSRSTGSGANADSYSFRAEFDGGVLAVETGNYWFGTRGGTVTGAAALERLIVLLGLSISSRTARAWGVKPVQGNAAPRDVA